MNPAGRLTQTLAGSFPALSSVALLQWAPMYAEPNDNGRGRAAAAVKLESSADPAYSSTSATAAPRHLAP